MSTLPPPRYSSENSSSAANTARIAKRLGDNSPASFYAAPPVRHAHRARKNPSRPPAPARPPPRPRQIPIAQTPQTNRAPPASRPHPRSPRDIPCSIAPATLSARSVRIAPHASRQAARDPAQYHSNQFPPASSSDTKTPPPTYLSPARVFPPSHPNKY